MLNGLVLFDSVDRVPLEVQGNVSRMSGLLRVHNQVLSSNRCVSACLLVTGIIFLIGPSPCEALPYRGGHLWCTLSVSATVDIQRGM